MLSSLRSAGSLEAMYLPLPPCGNGKYIMVAFLAGAESGSLLAQTEDRQQGIVNAPQLLSTQMASEVAEPLHGDRTNLLHQHPSRLTG